MSRVQVEFQKWNLTPSLVKAKLESNDLVLKKLQVHCEGVNNWHCSIEVFFKKCVFLQVYRMSIFPTCKKWKKCISQFFSISQILRLTLNWSVNKSESSSSLLRKHFLLKEEHFYAKNITWCKKVYYHFIVDHLELLFYTVFF